MNVRDPVDRWLERVAPEDLAGQTGAHHLARYLFAGHFAAGRSVADLCCGTGYGTNLLLAAGASQAIGVDISARAIEEARRRFPGPEFAVADVTERLDLQADLRVCFEGIEHVPDPEGLVRNLRSQLPANGVAILSTPNGEHGHSGNPHHLHEFSRAELRKLLSPEFSSVRIYFQWSYPDPLDQSWGLGTVTKALIPVRLKTRLRRPRPQIEGAANDAPITADSYRPLPEAELKVLPPGLRYGRPRIWIAVCRP
jgi:SAM-dependent methyltransferase